ncbi:galactonate dehydratase [Bacillus sp. Marseille-Q3570]|uniref:galactonate dehydratase n=1 Tax=Bacillus sp. Marseille-Q3570 TaxID=2963522 RepID=UPI0021B77D3F|nr:galactonate dehydratase [Bacillus sp. Marseille-Q3570]
MKIAEIQTFCVPPRWIFIRVETDDGFVGWGESIVPKRVNAVIGAIRDLAKLIKGEDPRKIEDIWQRLYRGGFFRGGPILMTALAGIEHSLWDIKGKYYGMPVYEFFGGEVREKVRAYAWVGGDRPANIVEHARRRVMQGFTAIKMNATEELHFIDSFSKIESVVERVASIREEFGSDLGIAVDFHGRVHRAMAKVLINELEPYHLMWIEEPLLSEHNDALPSILRETSTPIATGERLYNRWDFKQVFESRIVDIIQPDVSFTGIYEMEKLARMAEAYDVLLAPHCPNGPISLAASLQIDMCVSNVVMQEQSLGIHYNTGHNGLEQGEMYDYLVDSTELEIKDGFLYPPKGMGLGISINEDLVRGRDHSWDLRDDIWRNNDGTLAEW